MFERWRQENYFRYARIEFALDALVDYQVEPGDPTRTVPNPEKREVAKQIKSEILSAKGDLHVDGTVLTVTLDPLSSPHRTEVVSQICQTLTDSLSAFPGSFSTLFPQLCEIPTALESTSVRNG